jgi:hypothetical protein
MKALIIAALFATTSVRSVPVPANYFDWLRYLNLRPGRNVVSAAGHLLGESSSCLPNIELSPKKLAATLKADPTTSYFTSSQMTKDKCSRHCTDTFGSPIVYAMFDGNKCFCLQETSNAWNYFSSLETVRECDSKCSGRKKEYCGGSSILKVLEKSKIKYYFQRLKS